MVKRKVKYPKLKTSKEDRNDINPWDYTGPRRKKFRPVQPGGQSQTPSGCSNDMNHEQFSSGEELSSDEETVVLGLDLQSVASSSTDAPWNVFMKFPNWNTIPDNLIRLEDLLFEVEIFRFDDEPDGDMDVLYKNQMKDKGIICIAGIGRFKMYGDFFKQIESLQHTIFTVQISNRKSLAETVTKKSLLDPDTMPLCNIVLTIYIDKPGDLKWGKPSQQVKHIFDLMFSPLHSSQSDTHSCHRPLKPDIEALYNAVKEKHTLSVDNDNLPTQHASLIPSLRLYQKQALQWMLRRELPVPEPKSDPEFEPEQEDGHSSDECHIRRRCRRRHHATFIEIVADCGTRVYYHSFDGSLKVDKPAPLELPTGGILADEMGLGKTVEVLSLILANPRNLQLSEEQNDTLAESQGTTDTQPNDLAEPVECKLSTVKEDCIESALAVLSKGKEGQSPKCTKCRASQTTGDNLLHAAIPVSVFCKKCEENPECTNWGSDEEEGENLSKCKISAVIEEVVGGHTEHTPSKSGTEGGGNNTECTISAVIEDVVRGNFERCSISAVIEQVVQAGTSGKSRGKKKVAQKTKVAKLSLLKQAAVRFYDSQLQTVNRKVKEKLEVVEGPQVVCLCGNPAKGTMLKCSTCGTLQHAKCVGVDQVKLQHTYYCPQCWQNKKLLVTGATLIVSPGSICDQWVTEVKKHISDPDFKIHVYSGVNKNGFEQPTDLAKYNIVITTYETLRNELKFAFINQTLAHRFRSKKRFVAPPSPLVCLQWWRVCLDEAQMAQGTSTQIGMMARRLDAVHRWAVTGTPLHRSIDELFGMVDFLGLEFYAEPRVWRSVISDPYRAGNHEPLHRLMAKVMWRTAKKDILDQLHIPAQTEEIHWVHFSPVEEHFYRTEQESSSLHFHVYARFASKSKSAILATRLSEMDRSTLCSIMRPLRYVRQACTHLQLRRKLAGTLPSHQMLTMEEVLEQMIKKTSTEGDEALREHIAAINGLAALHIIAEEWVESVRLYRSVLHLTEQYRDQLNVDKLQTIHTLHNLADVLDGKHPGVAPTLRDDSLRDEAARLETKYMERHEQQLASSVEQLEELSSSVPAEPTTWWADLLVWVYAEGHVEELTRRLEESYTAPNDKQRVLLSDRGREIELAKWTGQLLESRNATRLAMTQLHEKALTANMAVEAANCHLTQSQTVHSGRNPDARIITAATSRCSICKVEDILKKYEVLLFAIRTSVLQHSLVGDTVVFGKLTDGTWLATDQETCLKVLHTVGRNKKADDQWLAEGVAHFKFLDVLKKEFRRQRSVWTQLRDIVAARDELHMCRLRLRLIQPGDSTSDMAVNRHILDPFAVPWHRQTLNDDRTRSESTVKRKIGIQQYLKNLRKNSDVEGKQEPCPVCRAELTEKWSVLQCGHVFCLDCVKNLGRKTVTCALCRETTHSGGVSYVYAAFKRKEGEAEIIGSHSSKVVAILRCLLNLIAQDPLVKVLVFSTWEVVLDVLDQALVQNGVTFTRLPGKNFQQNVKLFKTDPKITALLLPLHSGSKGLNLTEASHVILVEPILNPGDELQALGRVHRFGQTKQTVVHRFLVYGSIEERIYRAVSSNLSHWEEDTVTLGQLYELFKGCRSSEAD